MITRRRPPSIGAQVSALVVICLLLVGALITFNSRTVLRHDREVVSADLEQHAVASAEFIGSAIKPGGDTEQTLASLADQPAVTGLGAGCDAVLTSIQKGIAPGLLEVVDSRGVVLCSPFAKHRGKPLYAASASLLLRIAARQAGLDVPLTNPLTGQLGLAIGVPLKTRQAASLVYVGDTQDELAPEADDPDVESLVVDTQSGTVLMRSPARADAVGKRLGSSRLGRALRADGVTSAVGVDGVRRLYRQVQLEGTHLRLLVGHPESTAYASAYQGLRRNIGFGGVIILIVGLLGYLLHRRIARPASRLRRAIQDVAEGGNEPAPTTGPAELAELGIAFNDMIEAQRRTDGRARAIVQNASDYLLVVDEHRTVSYASPSAEAALGLRVGNDSGSLLGLVHSDDRGRALTSVAQWLEDSAGDLALKLRTLDPHGEERHLDLQAQNLLHDSAVAGVVITGRDVTERTRFEEHLSHQARHDPLTGLPNRAAVLERLAARQGSPLAVLYLDLDRFKLINDSHGHPVGDHVLVSLGGALQRALRPGDVVSRFGGDEFVMLAPGVATSDDAVDLAERVQLALAAPLNVDQRELFVSGSIGIAMAGPGDTPEGLLRHADTAMYRAKSQGRNCYALYDEAMREEALRLLRTETGLHRALERDELVLAYQPQFALADGTVTGAEALIRWNHPQHGLVRPDEFIPVAEETGLIVPIGEWVLREACSWAARVATTSPRALTVSVNVSPRQLAQPEFLDLVRDVLLTSGLAPELLCLEITETLLVQDADMAASTLSALRSLGAKVSIDDFGTGWSSLAYLRQFDVDEIKLDRSYVSSVTDNANAATIVASLVGMAHAMGLSVTAEGIETEGQLRFLRSTGCGTGQGYLFARPTTPDEVERLAAGTRSH